MQVIREVDIATSKEQKNSFSKIKAFWFHIIFKLHYTQLSPSKILMFIQGVYTGFHSKLFCYRNVTETKLTFKFFNIYKTL